MSTASNNNQNNTIYLNARDILSDAGFFEGTEKLLEVWFLTGETNGCNNAMQLEDGNQVNALRKSYVASGAMQLGNIDSIKNPINSKATPVVQRAGVNESSLRMITQNEWSCLLNKYVNCSILSCIRNEYFDAYLLSESSLFVYDTRFILKTCGTTKNLAILEPIISLAREKLLFSRVEDVFYSRRGYSNPKTQPSPHKSFDEEVKHLNSMFENGSAYILGKLNGDPWYLYMLDYPQIKQVPDQTFEILMTKLQPEIMSHFAISAHSTAQEMMEAVGLDELVSDFKFDLKAFDPCGFSLNGINGDFYVTIHITPQIECSYASFETNLPKEDYTDMACSIFRIFAPTNILITNFTNKCSLCPNSMLGIRDEQFVDYKLIDKQFCMFSNSYNVTLLTLTKL